MLADAREGLSFVIRNRYLRAISICTGTSNFFFSMSGALIVVYAVRELDMSPAALGLAFSLGNVGPLLAALHDEPDLDAGSASARRSCGRRCCSPPRAFLPLAPKSAPLPFLVAFGVIAGFGAVAYNITQLSFRQAICPERMQGRMNSVIRFLVWGTMPLGALLGGALGTWIGLRPALWVAAIGALLHVPPDPPLAGAEAARDAGAGRGAAALRGRGSGRAAACAAGALSARRRLPPAQRCRSWRCPSCRRSRRGCASSTRSCRRRRCSRPGPPTSRR